MSIKVEQNIAVNSADSVEQKKSEKIWNKEISLFNSFGDKKKEKVLSGHARFAGCWCRS